MAEDCGTVTVVEPFDEDNVSIPDWSLLDEEVEEGGEVTVELEIENGNVDDASVDVSIVLDGEAAGEDTVTVSGESSETFQMSVPVDLSPGDYSICPELSTVEASAPAFGRF